MVQGGEVTSNSCGRHPQLAKSDVSLSLSATRGPGPAGERIGVSLALELSLALEHGRLTQDSLSTRPSRGHGRSGCVRSRWAGCGGLYVQSAGFPGATGVLCRGPGRAGYSQAELSSQMGLEGAQAHESPALPWATCGRMSPAENGQQSQQSPGSCSSRVPEDLTYLAAVTAAQLLCPASAPAEPELCLARGAGSWHRAVPLLCSQHCPWILPQGLLLANSPSPAMPLWHVIWGAFTPSREPLFTRSEV